MDINLFIKSKKLNQNYTLALQEYLKRLKRFAKISLITGADFEKETEKYDKDKKRRNILVVPGNATPTSVDLAEQISKLMVEGYSTLNFFLVSSETNEEQNISCHEVLSLSEFTFSEGLTAVVMSEQIYRAFCILNHITYHK